MKHIFLNLKRFDVPVELGGVNRLAPMADWGAAIVRGTSDSLTARQRDAASPARSSVSPVCPQWCARLITAVLRPEKLMS